MVEPATSRATLRVGSLNVLARILRIIGTLLEAAPRVLGKLALLGLLYVWLGIRYVWLYIRMGVGILMIPESLAILTLVAVTVSTYLIFVWVPTEASMGIVQRIFYIHVSSAAVAFMGFLLGGFAAIGYLLKRVSARDDFSVACNEVGLLFACVNLITGCLWAKPVWGVYWAWDARLTAMLLLALIYAAYLILRQSITEPGQRAVVCAVVSIFGMVDVPIVYMANRWWRTQHPAPVIGGGGSLDPRMAFVLFFTMFALILLFCCLVQQRSRLESMSRAAEALRREVQTQV